MYQIVRIEKASQFQSNLDSLSSFPFGVKNKTYKIKEEPIKNILIYQKELAHPLAITQAEKKYQKLMMILPDLLISDDDDGECLREALNQIERFRQIIKNKYRSFLTKKELEAMAKKLSLIQQQAKQRMMEIQISKTEEKHRSSCK